MLFLSSKSFFYLAILFAVLFYQKTNSQKLSCNFDTDFCDYNFNEFVSRYTGESPSLGSGPIADHTTGAEGYYVLCEGSKLRDPASFCKLYKEVNLIEETDFQFWYFMYGAQIGTLELIADGITIWSLTGQQTNSWLLATLKLQPGNYMLEFSANRSTTGRSKSDIAIDDISLMSEELTTSLITPTRTTVLTPSSIRYNTTVTFDTFNNLLGWHSDYNNYKWIQINGNTSMFEGSFGPGSDYSSIKSSTFNLTVINNRPLNVSCAIPYCLNDNVPQYYCKQIFSISKSNYMCDINPCGSTPFYGKCNMGYYMMITNEKFETPIASFRSRFISPVYALNDGPLNVCLGVKYNIYSKSNDGFKFFIENYIEPNEIVVLYQTRGPLKIDMWHSLEIQIRSLNFNQFRFIFEPIRGSSLEYASISIDNFEFLDEYCVVPLTTVVESTTIEVSTSSEIISTSLERESSSIEFYTSGVSTSNVFLNESTTLNTSITETGATKKSSISNSFSVSFSTNETESTSITTSSTLISNLTDFSTNSIKTTTVTLVTPFSTSTLNLTDFSTNDIKTTTVTLVAPSSVSTANYSDLPPNEITTTTFPLSSVSTSLASSNSTVEKTTVNSNNQTTPTLNAVTNDPFTQNVIGIVLGVSSALVIIVFSSFCLYKHFKKPNKVSAVDDESNLNQQEMKEI